MRLLAVLAAPLLGQVTTLPEAEAAVTQVETTLRAAAADISAAWTDQLAASCELADPFAAERLAKMRDLDAAAHVANSIKGQSNAQQTHLQGQVDVAEESYRSAASMKASSTAELSAEQDAANATLSTLRDVVEMIRLRLGNKTGGAGEVVGVFNGMVMGSEEQVKTLAESIQAKSGQYSEIMTTAGREVRALQEMYVEQHQKAITATEKLASVEAQRALLDEIAAHETEVLKLRRTVCEQAQAGEQAFKRRADNLENQAAQTQSVLSASLVEARRHPAKTEVAATAVDALAAKVQSEALGRLAADIRDHSTEEDLHMLTQLEHTLRDEAAGDDCELQRMQATAQQTAAREEVLGLQARNASLAAAVGLADAQLSVLQPVVDRSESESTAAAAAVTAFQTAWSAGLQAAEDAEGTLSELKTFADEYAATENATVDGASLPNLVALLQTNVGALQSESTTRSTSLTDAAATYNLRNEVVSESRRTKLAAVAAAKSANATEESAVVAELAAANTRLEEARTATDVAINCTASSSVVLRSLEKRVVRVAQAALRGGK